MTNVNQPAVNIKLPPISGPPCVQCGAPMFVVQEADLGVDAEGVKCGSRHTEHHVCTAMQVPGFEDMATKLANSTGEVKRSDFDDPLVGSVRVSADIGAIVFALRATYENGWKACAEAQEKVLAERWRKLLYAESCLQAQRDEIDSVLDDAPPETVADRVRDVLKDQVSRPSPDFRALLLKTRKQLVLMKECVTDDHPRCGQDAMPAFKEALRLTDVERLGEWPPPSAATIALRLVVDHVVRDLERDMNDEGDPMFDQLWFEETHRDLLEARNDPDKFLARHSLGHFALGSHPKPKSDPPDEIVERDGKRYKRGKCPPGSRSCHACDRRGEHLEPVDSIEVERQGDPADAVPISEVKTLTPFEERHRACSLGWKEGRPWIVRMHAKGCEHPTEFTPPEDGS